MILVTSEEMRKLDDFTIQELGIPSLVLMENAGKAVADHVLAFDKSLPPVKHRERRIWAILVGKGNNGGDGIVAARHLADAGLVVHIIYAEDNRVTSKDALKQKDIIDRFKIGQFVHEPGKTDWKQYSGIIDCLLGTGAKGNPREPYASLIREVNDSGVPVVAVDIPSGLNADTGQLYKPCIQADLTITLAMMKQGLAQYPGLAAAGVVKVASIGIPYFVAEQHGIQTYLLDEASLKTRLNIDPAKGRAANTHKGSYGHVLVVAGSLAMSGAGQLCAKAALRGGCGLVTWAMPSSIALQVAAKVPEVMVHGVPDDSSGQWAAGSSKHVLELASRKSAMAIGPGLGRFNGDAGWLRQLWAHDACPLVLDADALNMLADADDFARWGKRKQPAVLTPHPGEMARLIGRSVQDVQHDRIEVARHYALQHGVTLVLKGARTVVAAPDGDVFVNTTGNPGMATGGAGDVLAGVITSLLAQGFSAKQAAALGVYLHGAAGDRAAAGRISPGSLIASDIIKEL